MKGNLISCPGCGFRRKREWLKHPCAVCGTVTTYEEGTTAAQASAPKDTPKQQLRRLVARVRKES